MQKDKERKANVDWNFAVQQSKLTIPFLNEMTGKHTLLLMDA